MANSKVRENGRVSRRLLVSLFVGWLLVVAVFPIAAPTLNLLSVADLRLGFALIVPVAFALLAFMAIAFAWRFKQPKDGRLSGGSFALALQAIGAGGLVASVAAISTLGFDGLSIPSGIIAGLALLTIFLIPRLSAYRTHSVVDFFEMRFESRSVWAIAAVIVGLSSVPLMAANIQALGIAIQGLVGFSFLHAGAIAATLIVFGAVYGAFTDLKRRSVFAVTFALLCLSVVLTVGALAVHSSGSPISAVLFGPAIVERAELEQKLISSGLADFSSLVPMTSPFLNWSAMNYIGVVLAVALGTAVLPNVTGLALASSESGDSRDRSIGRCARAVVWLALIAMLFAPFAVHARLGVLKRFEAGIDVSEVPSDLLAVHSRGWASLCGQDAGSSTSAIADACNGAPDSGSSLRLQDLNMLDEAWVLAGPMLAGLPAVFSYLLWFSVALAAVLVGQTLLRAAGDFRGLRSARSQSLSARFIIPAMVLTLAGLVLVLSRQLGLVAMVTDGLALFAAGLFPALALALFWRGMNAVGAVAAMVTGFGLLVLYIAGVRLFPFAFYEWTGALSAAGQQGLTEIELFKEQIAIAASPEERMVLVNDLNNYVRAIANWGGLIPPAGVLFAIPVGLIAGVLGSFAGRFLLHEARADG